MRIGKANLHPAPSGNRIGARTTRVGGRDVQSSAVLGVKPAIEDVNADCFLAFRFAELKTKSSPTA
jgi:hypothetical protein